MDVVILDSGGVSDIAVRALGLDGAGVDLFSDEGLTASVRRAASFVCPTTAGRIAGAVFDALAALPGAAEGLRDELETTVERLSSYGDLLELEIGDGVATRRRTFLGPPSFVRRSNGAFLLLGVRPEGVPFVDDALAALIEYEGHTRTVRSADETALQEMLHAAGISEMTREQWLRTPRAEPAADVVNGYSTRLYASGPSGDIEGITVLDSAASVSYYRGRWRHPRSSDSGDYVARRPQAFGADVWCFASLADGHVRHLVDLPVQDMLGPGRDEAWRLQAAIDSVAGHPQRVRLRPRVRDAATVVDLYAPPPSWVQRYLDAVGTPLTRSGGALFSYAVATSDAEEVSAFLAKSLWMSVVEDEGRHDRVDT